ncbi:hypothetical protein JCM11491_003134 [Sporobolomyces phaffii]
MDHLSSERTPLLQPVPVCPLLPFPDDALRPRRPRPRSPRQASSPPDVELSLSQLVQVAASLRAGHLPSTRQFLDLADYLLTSPSSILSQEFPGTVFEPTCGQGRLGVGKFTERGEALRTAARDWLESARDFTRERNPSIERPGQKAGRDGWQEFISSWRESEIKIDPPSLPRRPDATDTTPSNVISSSLFTLVSLFFTSPEIRQLVIDLIVLLRDIAQVALDTEVREDRLPEEAADGLEKAVDYVAQRGISTVALGDKMQEENGKKVNGFGVEATEDPPLVDLASDSPVDETRPVIPDQSPQQLRDTFIDRLKHILTRLQSTREYQSAMSTLPDIVRTWIKESVSRLIPSVSIESDSPSAARPQSPVELLVPLLEPFTGGPSSLSSLVESFHLTLAHLSPTNPESTPHEIAQLASNVDDFLSQVLLSPEFVSSSRAQRQAEGLYDSFSRLGSDQPAFNRDLQSLLKQGVQVATAVSQDEYLSRFVKATTAVLAEVEQTGELLGITTVKAASGQGLAAIWGDLAEWLAPRVLGVIKEIPLPRIEFDSPTVSGALEFPSLLSTSFVPASLVVRNSTSLTYLPTFGSSTQTLPISRTTLTQSRSHSSEQSFYERSSYASNTSVELSGMEFEILDVGYFVRLKSRFPCFPTITESGLLDLHFGRADVPAARDGVGRKNGFGFTLDTSSVEQRVAERRSLFETLPSSAVSLDAFDVRLHESDHPWFMWLARPLLRTTIRKAIEVEVRKVMIEQGDKVGAWAYRVRAKKDEVEEDARRAGRTGGAIWNWVRALWETVAEDDERTTIRGREGDEEDKGGDGEAQTETTLHLNRRGLAVDLPHPVESDQDDGAGGGGATVGFGTEGVVIPEGEAAIPVAPGQEPRVGVVERAKREANEAVDEGRTAARNAWAVVGGIGEASEEWRGDLEAERDKYERAGWRSDVFDLRSYS